MPLALVMLLVMGIPYLAYVAGGIYIDRIIRNMPEFKSPTTRLAHLVKSLELVWNEGRLERAEELLAAIYRESEELHDCLCVDMARRDRLPKTPAAAAEPKSNVVSFRRRDELEGRS